MKNLTKLINGVKKSSVIGLSALILYFPFSCATMTKAQKASLLGDVLTVAGEVGLPGKSNKTKRTISDAMSVSGRVISKQASMQHDLEVANTGKSSIVINNGQQGYQNSNQNQNQNQYQHQNQLNHSRTRDNSTPEGLFAYKKWVDFNNDSRVNRDELIGLNDPVYGLDKEECLRFSFYGGLDRRYEGENLKFKIYNMESGKEIGSLDQVYFDGSRMITFYFESVFFSQNGKYKAVLNAGNRKTFSLDFKVLK